uniref:Uncharacterized protein n=1 Tax=Oryza sativa subsp. japonica TaxID=39947 RepID=Q5VPU8_ORYSJ|nr:hypothetical protein [Oryza sativa Japonica Group]
MRAPDGAPLLAPGTTKGSGEQSRLQRLPRAPEPDEATEASSGAPETAKDSETPVPSRAMRGLRRPEGASGANSVARRESRLNTPDGPNSRTRH